MDGPGGYDVPQGQCRVEQVVQRSRFVTTVARASSPEMARAFVQSIRAEFPDATHHCWAFQTGPPGSTAQVGMSDAGEPHGTAGKPMLTVLLHSGVGEIVAVCTRYYGGVKLGTGGLSRAYAGGVSAALETLTTERKVERIRLTLHAGYEHVDAVRRVAGIHAAVIRQEQFGTEVTFELDVPVSGQSALVEAIYDITKGKGRFTPGS